MFSFFHNKLLNEIAPREFFCPFMQTIMLKPVITDDGYIFEEIAIKKWLSVGNSNPITNTPLKSKQLFPAIELEKKINVFLKEKKILTLTEFLSKNSINEQDPCLPQHLLYLPEKSHLNFSPFSWETYFKNTHFYLDLNQPKVQAQGDDEAEVVQSIDPLILKKAGEFNAPVDIVVFAVWGIWLYRYTQHEDIMIARSTNFLLEKELTFKEFFVPMKLHFSAEDSFKLILKGLKQQIQADNQQIHPLNILDFILWLERNGKKNGHFNLIYGECSSQSKPFEIIKNKELALSFKENKLTLTYKKHLFNKTFVDHFFKSFFALLNQLLDKPELAIKKLSLIDPLDEQKLLVDWNGAMEMRPFKMTAQLFEEQVLKSPNAIALQFNKESLTYDALNKRANQLAHYLKKEKLHLGDRIGIYLNRSFEAVITILAVMKIGAMYVPLDPNYPAERIKYILEDSEPKAIITHASLFEQLPNVNNIQILALNITETEKQIAAQSQENMSIEPSSTRIAALLYTSGSTGAPKGVMIKDSSIVNRILWEHIPITQEDVFCHITSLNFIDSIWEIFSPLIRGLPVIIFSKDMIGNLYKFIEQLTEFKVTRLLLPPSLLNVILSLDKSLLEPLKVRYWTNSGEAVSKEICAKFVEKMPDRIFINIYGTTEVWDATVYTCNDYFKNNVSPCSSIPMGKPIPNTKILILDHHQQILPIGAIGELYIGGPGVSSGYWKKDQITAERFIKINQALYYRTGDLARYLMDGTIEYLGRKDFLIKIRGFRIEPGEIESLLLKLAFIKEAIVVDKIDPQGSKHLVVYWIANTDEKIPERISEFLRDYLQKRLPAYMVPSYFMLISKRPLTPNGKTDRNNLPVPIWHQSHVEFVAAQTEMEIKLIEQWKKILNFSADEKIGIETDFFTVGGTSILALELASRLSKEYHIDLSADILVKERTIKNLSLWMNKQLNPSKENQQTMITLKFSSEKSPNLFLFHPINGNLLCYRHLLKYLEKAELNIYGFTALDFTLEECKQYQSVERLVELYLKHLSQIPDRAGDMLLGYSFGGILAFEMALQLKEKYSARKISFLGLIDTPGQGKLPHLLEKDEDIIQYLQLTNESHPQKMIEVYKMCQFMQQNYTYDLKSYSEKFYYFLAEQRQADFPENYFLPWKNTYSSLNIIQAQGDHISVMSEKYVFIIGDKMINQLPLNQEDIQYLLSKLQNQTNPELLDNTKNSCLNN